jgi:hypothetical protein
MNTHVEKMFAQKYPLKPRKGMKLPKIKEESEEAEQYSGRVEIYSDEDAVYENASENSGIALETQEVEVQISPTKTSVLASMF